MSYEIDSQIKFLSERIKLVKEKRMIDRKSPETIVEDVDFRLGDLLTDFIYFSKIQYPFPTKKDLEKFHDKYSKKSKVNLQELYDKHWVRFVMNRIEIPYSITSALEQLKKGFPTEFKFIKNLSKYLNKKKIDVFTGEDLKFVIDDYNKNLKKEQFTETDFKDKGVLYKGMSGDYELHPHAKYLLFIKKHEVELTFIQSFVKQFFIDGDSKYYLIKKSDAKKIVSKHKKAYENSPTIEDLKEKKFLVDSHDQYIFKISYSDHSDWWSTLGDLISGKLWIKLTKDTRYANDDKRLDLWLDKIIVNSDYPSLCINSMPFEVRKDFILILETRILNEQDILGSPSEIEKIILEQSNSHGRYPLIDKIQLTFDEKQSAAEKYRLIDRLDRNVNNLFIEQRCRTRLGFLLHILIRDSKACDNSINSFPSIIKLLEASNDRPYLVWHISELITYIRPEIVPYLFAKNGLQELGVLLMPTFEINHYAIQYGDRDESSVHHEEFRSQINKEGLITLLNSISNQDHEHAAVVLARAIIEISKQIFYLPNNFDNVKQEKKQIQINAYNQTWEIIARFRIETYQFVYDSGKEKPLYILGLLEDFYKEVISFEVREALNEFYTPEIGKIDILIRLLSIIKDSALIQRKLFQPEYKEKTDSIEKEITEKLHESYLQFYTIEEIDVRYGLSSNLEKVKIRFQSNPYGLELVSWKVYLKSLTPTQRHVFFQNSFPNFEKNKTQNSGQRTFGLRADNAIHRLRFHFKIMLNMYLSLIEEDIVEKELVSELEKHLTQIYCQNSVTKIADEKIDIFNKEYDAYTGEYLFARLMEATNMFAPSYRQGILDSLVADDQFERILSSLSLLISQGDKKYLLKALTEDKLDKFLNEQSFYSEIENALVNAINTGELVDFAERIIKYIEEATVKVKSTAEQQSLLFHVKLLLAYRKNDFEFFKTIPLPDDKNDKYSQRRQTDSSRKDYYEIFFLHDNKNYQEAIEKVDKLAYVRREDPLVLDLRFSLYIEQAKRVYSEDIDKGKKLIKNALDEFDSSFKDCDKKSLNDFINKGIQLHKLECYNLLNQNANFDLFSSQITKTDSYTESCSSLIVDNKMKREQLTEASSFVEELTNFHRYRSGDTPDFIKDLRSKISSHENHVAHLNRAYKDILCLSEGQRIETIPDVVTKYNNEFGKFLLGELIRATITFQNKIHSLLKKGEKVEDMEEDKITDFIEIILNARLSAWQMQWNSQSRAGTTGKDTNQLARADLVINDANTRVIYEAFRIYPGSSIAKQKKKIVEHVKKVFNETSTRNHFYNLIYYQADKFDSHWLEFKDLIDHVDYSGRFKIISQFEELKSDSTSDLKVGITTHENGVVCYYLFINFNYPVI